MSLHSFLRESTWGYPIIAALHVLGIAWFGGTVLVASFGRELTVLRRWGLALLLTTGAVLFWLQPEQYYGSVAFWVKMGLVAVVPAMKAGSRLSLAVWVAIVFAARGIAFF